MTNDYHPDNDTAATNAAIVAAVTALGAEIDALRCDVQVQRERADEYQRAMVTLNEMLGEARAQVQALEKANSGLRSDCRKLGDELAKPARGVTWGDVQVLMVQNGIQEITRVDTYRWRAVSNDREYEDNSLEAAATHAARAFAAILGKAVTA